MTTSQSPAVARRRVRLALREARESHGLTQTQVADAMEWSLSKIMRIEAGEVTISPNDLRPLLAYLGIVDRQRIDELVQAAKLARRRRHWFDEPRFRENLTPATRQLIQYETEAVAVRYFHPMVVPGRLQTTAYAQAVVEGFRDELTDDEIETAVQTRLRRRADLLARRKDSPNTYMLLDESVLHRTFGGAHVAAEQLRDLLRNSELINLFIRILPFTIDAPVPLLGGYELIDLGEDNVILYRENLRADEIVEDPAKVGRSSGNFEALWRAALSEEESARMLDQHARILASGPPSADATHHT